MIQVYKSEQRGGADYGWLKSKHRFSFGQYYDPEQMGVSVLRVINDDRVIPGAGFATHPHKDMEIISFVKKGAIEHKDSMGNIQTLPAGEFQLMTAGTGITHSEYNPSKTEELEFLQIWITPDQLNLSPGYQQKRFPETEGMQLVISPSGAEDSLKLNQDASVYHLRLNKGGSESLLTGTDRLIYLHVISGELAIKSESADDTNQEAEVLLAGDGATLSAENSAENLALLANDSVEALVFDLPK